MREDDVPVSTEKEGIGEGGGWQFVKIRLRAGGTVKLCVRKVCERDREIGELPEDILLVIYFTSSLGWANHRTLCKMHNSNMMYVKSGVLLASTAVSILINCSIAIGLGIAQSV
jgi:hypothetical protein